MNKVWWKEAVAYQIYPRSFMDSNGDGIGDLPGILSKLDYLKDLGIDVIWLSPIYESPNDDNGYDISDYFDIMSEFGTMEDFDLLLKEVHARGMKLIMDLVVNHTSDEHPWFIESRSSKDNPKRDYYIWKPANEDGGPPNNWESFFSGSTWEYDEETGEYYLHLFTKKQPDLNWNNPDVVKDIYEMITWWLDKGIDGFRVDAINHMGKAEGFPDDPHPEDQRYNTGYKMFSNLPQVHEQLQKLNREVLSKYDIMTVGETSGVGPKEALLYVGEDRNEFNMVFQFEHMGIDCGTQGKWGVEPWSLLELKSLMSKWQTELYEKGWNALFFNNHDQPRAVSRFGDDGKYWSESAKLLATYIHTLSGTPFVYQGEEIGMTNVAFDSIDSYRDVEILNYYKEKVVEQGQDHDEIMKRIHHKGRDNSRTPMQWSTNDQAGFTAGTPWIEVNPNYSSINVEKQVQDPDSVLNYYKQLIQLRKKHEVLVYGDYELILENDTEIYAYTRTLGQEKLLVVLNFFGGTPTFRLPSSLHVESHELLISNYGVEEDVNIQEFQLQPYEARVYRIK
ncbi:oligo-1,6-glucosidase [Bacillus mesophilus]|uniref:Alpha-amylase n=1 Tax=Bacillus mesophilus TaxID=1808955 RepID=A0A6M0QA57_9BACI|nr:alpha-glucosidase [Bacillus mesophilus]MBM7662716.1 oligo-1,6-glucosidase [Bacillus mesophilus]NEY73222.1 alpha-glucosidase [Bacillus mesophilus]